MKVTRQNEPVSRQSTKLKVRVFKINGDMVECKHEASNRSIKAYAGRLANELSIGQVIEVTYSLDNDGGGYTVSNSLVEEIEAIILDAQHIIANGIMFTSIIVENPKTHKRLHSLVSSSERMFNNTSILIKGDIVNLRLNNGILFNIEVKNGNNT